MSFNVFLLPFICVQFNVSSNKALALTLWSADNNATNECKSRLFSPINCLALIKTNRNCEISHIFTL